MRRAGFRLFFVASGLLLGSTLMGEDGYELWLRYPPVDHSTRFSQYQSQFASIVIEGEDATYQAIEREIRLAMRGLLRKDVSVSKQFAGAPALIIGTPADSRLIASLDLSHELKALGKEGFLIRRRLVEDKNCIIIAANEPIGALYGTFCLLRRLQTHHDISTVNISERPTFELRLLNHWDNLDGTVERGYAGGSIWKWDDLPGRLDERYTDYARTCASVGINGMTVNNVNADPKILTTAYLEKVAALANVFRPYGIRVYLTANFAAPKEIGGLATADPLNAEVIAWWKAKTEEIYDLIPDFGGFLVKANSEGQPGPYDYHRTHSDGANMLGTIVKPHGGIVMWRAFVYGKEKPEPDRIKQAYQEFVPLDGRFGENVYVQVKNGPLDFQPREPINPLFGAMPKTRLSLELQITQEYLGHSTFLVYLAPMWKEVLDSPIYRQELGKTLVSNNSSGHYPATAIAGVANIGSNRNWTGHDFAQANWFAYGRLAWNPQLNPKTIAEEWARLTFTNDQAAAATITEMMMGSWLTSVSVMTPLGLNTLCNAGIGDAGHYSPAPASRAKFHKADESGIGFDRTSGTGSNAVGQYPEPLRSQLDDIRTCPEEYLLWFHHASWDHKMASGRSLWDELCYCYAQGANDVEQLVQKWSSLRSKIDAHRHRDVSGRLRNYSQQAIAWRDTCIDYFQDFSGQAVPEFKFDKDSSKD